MLISSKWLNHYIPEFNPESINAIKHRIDTRLSEVEEITKLGTGLSNLVVAEIVSTMPHPSNTKLTVCTVNDGTSDLKTVVCGADNVKVGLKTIYCKKGGYVIGSNKQLVQIEERQMGEVVSVGMLCAADEVGLGSDHAGIIELAGDSVVGEPVVALLQDTIIEIENKALPHRPDAFSHLGVARELSAIFKIGLNNKEYAKDLIATAEDKVSLEVDIQDTKSCTRFSAIAITGVKPGPSPLWLQAYLQHCGVRPVNNIVDVTNYVMLSIGQPLHAFDLDVVGPKLTVRMSRKDETVRTLDHKDRVIAQPVCVISSPNGIESIAGIMGGEIGEITTKTTSVIIEAAGWEMYQIRRASRNLGLRSEASLRYEKGLSNKRTVDAIVMATQLIQDLAGGEVASELIDKVIIAPEQKTINFDMGSIKRLAGVEIEKKQVVDILESLEFEISEHEKHYADSLSLPGAVANVSIKVPFHRQDINIEQDVVEEVVRIFGYENILKSIPKRDLVAPKPNLFYKFKRNLSKSLISVGSTELITYSMVSTDLYKDLNIPNQYLLPILAPISPELSNIRSLVSPSLVTKIKQNSSKFKNFSLFEISKVVQPQVSAENIPEQPEHLAVVFANESSNKAINELMQVFNTLNTNHFKSKLDLLTNQNVTLLHPGISNQIYLNNSAIGFLGQLHPTAANSMGLKDLNVCILEINISEIWEHINKLSVGQNNIKTSNLQSTSRDITFIQDRNIPSSALIKNINNAGIKLLESVQIIDYYQSASLSTFTLRLIIQPDSASLTSEQINLIASEVEKIGNNLGLKIKL